MFHVEHQNILTMMIALIKIENNEGFLKIGYRKKNPEYTTEIKPSFKAVYLDYAGAEFYCTKISPLSYYLKECIQDVSFWLNPIFITLYFYQYCNSKNEWILIDTKNSINYKTP